MFFEEMVIIFVSNSEKLIGQTVIVNFNFLKREMNMRLKKGIGIVQLLFGLILLMPSALQASEQLRVRVYFGLSLPNGGAVSLEEWSNFERSEITKAFDGFNVVDSTGYYKGKPERSKIVTIVLVKEDIPKVKKLARSYAEKFKQESVMVVTVPVVEWSFERSK